MPESYKYVIIHNLIILHTFFKYLKYLPYVLLSLLSLLLNGFSLVMNMPQRDFIGTRSKPVYFAYQHKKTLNDLGSGITASLRRSDEILILLQKECKYVILAVKVI